jgi:hypothetical protein
LLNGDVSAALKNGNLVISGDDGDNHVVLTQPAAGTFRLTGLDDTTVNGQASADFAGATGDLRISTKKGGGDDKIEIRGAIQIGGNVTANLGDGELVIEGTGGRVEIAGDVKASGTGDVSFRNDVVVSGATRVRTAGAASATANTAGLPDFSSETFSHPLDINNPHYPLVVGTVYTFQEIDTDPDTGATTTQLNTIEVTDKSRTVDGVEVREVHDSVFENNRLIEDTIDLHAQDDDGNVWYFGEDTKEFTYDDQGNVTNTSTEGSWTAGVNGGKPGLIMEANPNTGDKFDQEFQPGTVLDQGEIVATDASVTGPLGSFDHLVKTREFTALEPDSLESKFYAPGIGVVEELGFDITSGQVIADSKLQSIKFNGQDVSTVVPTDNFQGTNAPIGPTPGPVTFNGPASFASGDTTILRNAVFAQDVAATSKGSVSILDSQAAGNLTITAADSAGLSNDTVTGNLQTRVAGANAYVFDSHLNGTTNLRFGSADNGLLVKNSGIHDLLANGGGGTNTFTDQGGNTIDMMTLKKFNQ